MRTVYAVPLYEGLGRGDGSPSVLVFGGSRVHQTVDWFGVAVASGAMSLVLSTAKGVPLDVRVVSAVRGET